MAVFYVLLLLLGASLAVPGGWNTVDVNDKGVQKAAKFAADELDARTNSMYKWVMLTVETAESQIVAGVKYNLTFRFGELGCRREQYPASNNCRVKRYQRCYVKVWVKTWEDFHKLESFRCEFQPEAKERDRRNAVVGGERPIELASMQVKEAAQFVTQQLNSMTDDTYSVDFHRVISGTQQVVAGVMYRLKVELIMSSCDKTRDQLQVPLEQCQDNPHKSVIECELEVVDQAWLTPRHTLNQHRCHPSTSSDNALFFQQHNNKLIGGGDHDVGHYGEFEDFKQKYNKVYSTAEEEKYRYIIFQRNMRLAKQIQFYDLGTATYGASPFADLTADEFQNSYLSRRWDLSHDERLKPASIPSEAPSDQYDWRDHNAVTPVKNQGSCGSCWAFSVTGNIEGQWAIKKKKLLSLSEQELVDCDKLDLGCNGGLPSNAYQEIQRLGGLETETDYPYKGVDEKCEFVRQDIRVYINGSVNISKDENEMKSWIYKHGPVSIGINAFAMQFYLGGISHPWKIFCAPDYLDHGVAIVGYAISKGIFSNTPYWIVKNSWGPYWGEKGYYLVYRGGGVCGLNTMVSSAIVD